MIEDKKTLRKADIVFGSILFFIALFFFIKSLQMYSAVMPGTEIHFYSNPGLLPAIVSFVIMILSIVVIMGAFREGARVGKNDVKKALQALNRKESLRILLMSIIILVYVFGFLGRMPYYLSTFIYLFVFMYLFKAGNWWKVLLISAVTSFLITYSFGNLINIPLP